MGKKKRNPLVETLLAGEEYEIQVPEDGDLASMRAVLKHGQMLTLSPVKQAGEIQPDDIVFVRWHQGHILHLVSEIQGEQFLIVNSVGKVNGWVGLDAILGRVTRIVDPPPLPNQEQMFEMLEAAYLALAEHMQPDERQRQRLLSVADDLRWYAGRLGAERWAAWPRANKTSLRWHVWHLTRQAQEALELQPESFDYFIDHGKEHVGCAAEIYALFEYNE